MSAETWDDALHGVSYEDLQEACMEYIGLIGRINTILKAWNETGDDNLIEVLTFLLQDYNPDNYEFYEEEDEDPLEDDDGNRH